MSVNFGPMFLVRDVERAALELVDKWAPSYLRELERQHPDDFPEDSLGVPRSYSTRVDFEIWPEDQLPGVVAVVARTDDEPKRRGDGTYSATYLLGVGVAVGSNNAENTRTFAEGWGTVIRTIFVHRPSLEVPELGIRSFAWIAEQYDSLPSEEQRTVMAVQQVFRVQIDGLVQSGVGPDSPDDPSEYPPPPNTVTWTINRREIPS